MQFTAGGLNISPDQAEELLVTGASLHEVMKRMAVRRQSAPSRDIPFATAALLMHDMDVVYTTEHQKNAAHRGSGFAQSGIKPRPEFNFVPDYNYTDFKKIR